MEVRYDLVVDFARPSKSNTLIISEGDSNSRLLHFTLLSNKQVFSMSDVAAATIKGIKSDGSVIYGDATILESEEGDKINEIEYLLPKAIADQAGNITMTITLLSDMGQQLTSFEFYVQIRNALYNEDDLVSESDVSGFRDLLQRCIAAVQKIEEMSENTTLPNPFPLNLTIEDTMYPYSGNELVEIELKDMAYVGEAVSETEPSLDESAAHSAAESARKAKESQKASKLSEESAELSAELAEERSDIANGAKDAAQGYAGQAEAYANQIRLLIASLKNIDWDEDNPESMSFIKNKPFKDLSEDFIVDSEGTLHAIAKEMGLLPVLIIESTKDSFTITNGEVTIDPIYHDGVWEANIPSFGSWTINTYDAYGDASVTLYVDTVKVYRVYDSDFKAELTLTISEELVGETVKGSNGEEEVTWVADSTSHTFYLSFGTWKFSATKGKVTYESESVVIDTYSSYEANIEYYKVAGYSDWLDSAGIPDTFGSLEAVLEDEKTIRTLITKHASVDYMVSWLSGDEETAKTVLDNDYAAKWINLRDYALDTLYSNSTVKAIMDEVDKYFYGEWVEKDGVWQPKGNVPIMTSNNAPYGECFGSSNHATLGKGFYGVFDGLDNTSWVTSSGVKDGFIGYKSSNPICVNEFSFMQDTDNVYEIQLQGSNDGTTYTNIGNKTTVNQANKLYRIKADNENYYLYHRVDCKYVSGATGVLSVNTLQFYGRELKVSVPTMTSNTEPWGNAISLHEHSMSQYATYKAFDGNTSTYSSDNSNATSGLFVRYDFPFETLLKVVKVSHRQSGNTVRIDGSNDGDIWNAISENVLLQSNKDTTILTNTDTPYKKYRMYQVSGTSANGFDTNELQFYGLDYSEHEERHYIYDHGVEFSEFEDASNGGSIAYTNDEILIQNTRDSLYNILYAKNTFKNLKNARAKVGKNVEGGTNLLGCATTITSAVGAFNYISKDYMPNNVFLDINAITQDNYPCVGIGTGSGRKLTITEWWLE